MDEFTNEIIGYMPMVNLLDQKWLILDYIDDDPNYTIEVAIDYLNRVFPGIVYNRKTRQSFRNEFKHINGELIRVNIAEINKIKNELFLCLRNKQLQLRYFPEAKLRINYVPTLTYYGKFRGIKVFNWKTNELVNNNDCKQSNTIEPLQIYQIKDLANILNEFQMNNKKD